MLTIRETLNKLKWSTEGGLGDCEIDITHRGAPGDTKTILGSNIKDVAPRALIVEEDDEEVIIPFHRIRQIRKGGRVVWQKRDRRTENYGTTV